MIQKLNKLGVSWPPKKAKNDLIVERGVGALVPKNSKMTQIYQHLNCQGTRLRYQNTDKNILHKLTKLKKKRLKRHKFSGQGLLMFWEYKLWLLTQMANYNILLPPTFLKYCCIIHCQTQPGVIFYWNIACFKEAFTRKMEIVWSFTKGYNHKSILTFTPLGLS